MRIIRCNSDKLYVIADDEDLVAATSETPVKTIKTKSFILSLDSKGYVQGIKTKRRLLSEGTLSSYDSVLQILDEASDETLTVESLFLLLFRL